ncbi:serine/arginine repetitive matrix protein 2-like isoform X2 [Musca vetustissima]|uniref:serine/arginine repetitive matrix protein 2-like isoform X2 n=1 Tax=Musca vetustissima TaxID=27455 RepID=UPI002AB62F4C|nr:serine/arginine repetitive matrix protein 2-like isoform X2 [Musca vetustissima]
MYNGIGLTTPRGSGTNGHVQRNWAFVRPGKKDNSNYRSEEDIKKLDATLNRPPNKEILDHDRKRKIEVKCLEFEEILENQGLSPEEIKAKVDSYRQKLLGTGKTDIPKDEFGRVAVRDTHQIAEAQQEKNAKLREAFNISEYFVEGSSFDSDRKAKEDLAKSLALQKELDAQREQAAAAAATAAAAAKESSKRYALVRTPSRERDVSAGGKSGGEGGALGIIGGNGDNDEHSIKKKKKKRTRESSNSPERKKDKKKKSKKHKKESKSKKKKSRKRKSSESDSDDAAAVADENDSSDSEAEVKKSRKKSKKDKDSFRKAL